MSPLSLSSRRPWLLRFPTAPAGTSSTLALIPGPSSMASSSSNTCPPMSSAESFSRTPLPRLLLIALSAKTSTFLQSMELLKSSRLSSMWVRSSRRNSLHLQLPVPFQLGLALLLPLLPLLPRIGRLLGMWELDGIKLRPQLPRCVPILSCSSSCGSSSNCSCRNEMECTLLCKSEQEIEKNGGRLHSACTEE